MGSRHIKGSDVVKLKQASHGLTEGWFRAEPNAGIKRGWDLWGGDERPRLLLLSLPKDSSGSARSEKLCVIREIGIPWSKKEHRTFLEGLGRLGKGDWKGISKIFVLTRTPTQIASHVQKFFLRQATLNKKKRRSSLFDLAARTQVRCWTLQVNNDSIQTPAQVASPGIGSLPATSVVASHGIPSFQRVPYMIKLSFLDLFLNFRVKDKCFVHLLPLDKLYSEPSDKCAFVLGWDKQTPKFFRQPLQYVFSVSSFPDPSTIFMHN
ncbi:hypothetical protein GIB67_034171 [Kingdonia uniflora]|uniref:Uncharacterized protein n=1 Tax=Kingdonia uniflora TaxID=39325 RepID=A0A7J7NRI5_9MAGN|nr:hypothetical protein GIB67_034171 [Kingdonia uniflora]